METYTCAPHIRSTGPRQRMLKLNSTDLTYFCPLCSLPSSFLPPFPPEKSLLYIHTHMHTSFRLLLFPPPPFPPPPPPQSSTTSSTIPSPSLLASFSAPDARLHLRLYNQS